MGKYETERMRELRSTELPATDIKTLNQIEEYGCSVLSVGTACRDELSWTYTIGVYDTCGMPDLITVGLPFKVAQICLNEAAERMRSGADLTQGRHADLIGGVDCEFRPVDPKWIRHLMNWANWYYGGTGYPVLQAIYPDLANKFPEDEGFNSRFAQPLMQRGAPFTELERKFWDSVENGSKFPGWEFPNPPHTTAFLSKTVYEVAEPVTYVSHDADDGAWQFLGDSMAEGEPVLVCLHHPIDADQSLKELADLPLGWWAEREAPGMSWQRHKHEPQETSGSEEN
jgi:hypothetical protein